MQMLFKKSFMAMFLALTVSTPSFSQTSGKAIVAIYSIDDLAQSGQSAQLTKMLETAITATSKFRVIERNALGKLVGEQSRARSGLVTSNNAGKIGGFEGADFLIYGSITSASMVSKNLFGMRAEPDPQYPSVCMDIFVTFGVDIKITDARSGEVRYVSSINETKKAGTSCLQGKTLDLTNLLRSTSEKIASSLVTAVYPMQVASVQPDGVLVLNYGEGSVAQNAIYGIYEKGEAVIDPATGEKLGSDEEIIGYAQVTAVQGRISRAAPIGAFSRPPQIGAVARIATKAQLEQWKRAMKARR